MQTAIYRESQNKDITVIASVNICDSPHDSKDIIYFYFGIHEHARVCFMCSESKIGVIYLAFCPQILSLSPAPGLRVFVVSSYFHVVLQRKRTNPQLSLQFD